MAETRQLREWAFIATLVGGVLVLVGAFWMLGMMSFVMGGSPLFGGSGPDGPLGPFAGFLGFASLLTLVAGVLGIVAALRIRTGPPQDASTWGIVAIVAGSVSLLGMGGGMIGALALILGGAMAVTAAGRERDETPRQSF